MMRFLAIVQATLSTANTIGSNVMWISEAAKTQLVVFGKLPCIDTSNFLKDIQCQTPCTPLQYEHLFCFMRYSRNTTVSWPFDNDLHFPSPRTVSLAIDTWALCSFKGDSLLHLHTPGCATISLFLYTSCVGLINIFRVHLQISTFWMSLTL